MALRVSAQAAVRDTSKASDQGIRWLGSQMGDRPPIGDDIRALDQPEWTGTTLGVDVTGIETGQRGQRDGHTAPPRVATRTG
jgi:hypothetical protein